MEDMFGLAGKTALVWGGGQGMGEASAMRLARAGCDVAVIDMMADRAGKVAEQISALGRRSVALTADITNKDEVARATAAAEAALAPLDVMVNVIGMAGWVKLVDMDEAEWDRIMNLNLKGFFLAAQAAARSMIAGQRPGAIVSICSVSGLTSAPMHGHYGAAKAGMQNLVRSMANEWGPLIRVNAVAPGSTQTARVVPTPERIAEAKIRIPLERMAEPDEIAKAVLFMASDLASNVTGQTLACDGGWTAMALMKWKQDFVPPPSENVAYAASAAG
jgi:NAD(P)-dependent dehydrogenase (short-subunit alcohol dehydrogenase family)